MKKLLRWTLILPSHFPVNYEIGIHVQRMKEVIISICIICLYIVIITAILLIIVKLSIILERLRLGLPERRSLDRGRLQPLFPHVFITDSGNCHGFLFTLEFACSRYASLFFSIPGPSLSLGSLVFICFVCHL